MRGTLALAVLTALSLASGARAQTVDQVVATHAGGCTTAGVEGLSEQLVDSHLCAYPGSVGEFTPHPNITLTSSRVYPLATAETVTAIRRAADTVPLSVNSAFRTLVEQYLLYEEGGCALAAEPGNSNHQSGRAVDLGNYTAARSAMIAAGCTHTYPTSDPVHFDCPGPDMRQASVLIFQRLWNRNNPGDLIDEDGAYGPQTGARLGASPAAGFAASLCEVAPAEVFGAELVAQSFPLSSAEPLVLAPGEERAGTLELLNIGTAAWGSATHLGTTGPRDGASLIAAADWVAPNRPARVTGSVVPGASYVFAFSLRGPALPGDYCQPLGVLEEGVAWFSEAGHLGPPDGALEVCVRVEDEVVPGTDAGLADAGLPLDDAGRPIGTGRPGGTDGCGCRAVGLAPRKPGAMFVAMSALLAARRRRRA